MSILNLTNRKILQSFGLMSGVTLIVVALGLITTKIVAIFGGVEVFGILDLYRKLLGLVVTALAAGSATVIVQRISHSNSYEHTSKIVSSTFDLFIVQTLIIFLLGIFFADNIALWLFTNSNLAIKHIVEIRIVLALAIVVLFSQTMTALINGKINLKKVAFINIVTALTTMLASYPLLKLGNIGVSLLVGFGSILGSFVGFIYVRNIYKDNMSGYKFSLNVKDFFSSIPTSKWLLMHTLISSITLLNIQVMVRDSYGLNSLGLYAAVTIINTTLLMVLMPAMKTYFIPTLGGITNIEDKKIFINKIIHLLLIVILPITVLIMFLSEYILIILFSSEFSIASELLMVQIMSILSAAFCWPYANYLLHNGEYKIYLLVDVIWALFLTSSIWFFTSNGYELSVVPLLYFFGSILSLLLFILTLSKIYGGNILSRNNLKFGVSSFVIILLTYFIITKYDFYVQVVLAFVLFIWFIFIIKKSYKNILLEL